MPNSRTVFQKALLFILLISCFIAKKSDSKCIFCCKKKKMTIILMEKRNLSGYNNNALPVLFSLFSDRYQ